MTTIISRAISFSLGMVTAAILASFMDAALAERIFRDGLFFVWCFVLFNNDLVEPQRKEEP